MEKVQEKTQVKEEDETRINMYIQSLSEKKHKAYFIAKSHLGSTFNTLKSVGFLYWEKEKKKDLEFENQKELDFEKQKENLEKKELEKQKQLEKQKELEQELKKALEKAQEKIKIKIKTNKKI